MQTTIEDLPVELWISILSYLEAHELLHAFTGLNSHFNRLISSDYLLFHVRLGKTNRNPLAYATEPYWPNSILARILSLQPVDPRKTSHIPEFLRWHSAKFQQLQFLKVKLRGREIPAICHALRELHSLHHLSIECVPNQMLLNAILCVPTLRICHADFLHALAPIRDECQAVSHIERLSMILRDDPSSSITNFILSHTPNLQSLAIHSPEIYFDNRPSPFTMPTFILPALRTIKIHWSLMYCNPIFFQSLHEIMPNLQRFELDVIYNYLTEDFFEYLICYWWPTIETIERVNMSIHCRRPQLTIDNCMQMNVDKFQSTLLAMNEKYQGSVKVKWTETVFIGHKIIEIAIHKS